MQLRSDVFAACIEEDVVLLDGGTGEYLCLPSAAPAFAFADGKPPTIVDADLAQDALAMGLVGLGDQPRISTPPVLRDLPTDPVGAIHLGERLDAVGAYWTMVRRYHGRPFPELIAYARAHRQAEPSDAITPAHIVRAQAFRRMLPWAPFQGVCLYRSFFLLTFLRRSGLDATWMFGVRTWPFEAHCWLQIGDLVLDDTLDHVRRFSPILAV